jgi:hypothetical protein
MQYAVKTPKPVRLNEERSKLIEVAKCPSMISEPPPVSVVGCMFGHTRA